MFWRYRKQHQTIPWLTNFSFNTSCIKLVQWFICYNQEAKTFVKLVQGETEPFKPFRHRYHVPYKASGSTAPFWYSIKRGSAYIIVLASYSAYGKNLRCLLIHYKFPSLFMLISDLFTTFILSCSYKYLVLLPSCSLVHLQFETQLPASKGWSMSIWIFERIRSGEGSYWVNLIFKTYA